MKNYFKKHPLAKTGLLGVPLIIFVIFMGFFFPRKAPENFGSFIVAFEFAKTPAELRMLFDPLTLEEVQKIDIGNYLDFGFMITYSTLLVVAFWKLSQLFNKKFLKAGVFIAIVILISDFFENLFLLRLTENYLNFSMEGEIISNLNYLSIFTWTKWISLSVIFSLFYTVFYKQKWYLEIPAAIFLFPLLYFIASPGRTPEILTNFTNSVFFCFACFIMFLIVSPKKWIERTAD